MEDEENQDVFVDLKNFNCKRCGQFPQELTIYTCTNIINRKECGFNYCPTCAKNLIKIHVLFVEEILLVKKTLKIILVLVVEQNMHVNFVIFVKLIWKNFGNI